MRVSCSDPGVREAALAVRRGGIVVFPTDTVYGIGCDPHRAESVGRIYRIKSRDPSKPLPVLAHDMDHAALIAMFDDVSCRLADRFWPGQLTIILKATDMSLAPSVRAGGKVAVRVPDHPCTCRLLAECGLLTGTSANLSGGPPLTDPARQPERIPAHDILLDGGASHAGIESTVVDATGRLPKVVREGAIRPEAVFDA